MSIRRAARFGQASAIVAESRDSGRVRDQEGAERWIGSHVQPTGAIEIARERPWSMVLRVPMASGSAWFKACSPVQAFEPRLSADLFDRWPDRVAEVLAYDERRGWLLLADAGRPISALGNPPQVWVEVLPRYAELQLGEAVHANEHIAHGVPALPLATLPARYAQLLDRELPLQHDELARLHAFSPRFEKLCSEVAARRLAATVQHDDLHMGSVHQLHNRFRVLDWGDSSISHPFFSLVATFRFLEEITGLEPHDRWFARLRDAYLEPWGDDLEDLFDLALRVGRFAHAIAWDRQRGFIPPPERAAFDKWYAHVLRRALGVI
jgi:Phosphotransferase enzyme family